MRWCLGALIAASAIALPVPRDLLAVGSEDDALAVVLLIDLSASMARHVAHPENPSSRERLEIVTGAFLAALRPGDHARFGRVAGGSVFTGMFELASTYLADQIDVFDATAAERYGASPIWDGLVDAVGRLEAEPGRRAVIVWTDGRASGNHATFRDVVARARAAGVSINVLCVPTDQLVPQSPTTAVRVRPSVYLESMANVTGGVFLRVRGIEGTARAVSDIMTRLRAPADNEIAMLR
jgi:hypothetical protein